MSVVKKTPSRRGRLSRRSARLAGEWNEDEREKSTSRDTGKSNFGEGKARERRGGPTQRRFADRSHLGKKLWCAKELKKRGQKVRGSSHSEDSKMGGRNQKAEGGRIFRSQLPIRQVWKKRVIIAPREENVDVNGPQGSGETWERGGHKSGEGSETDCRETVKKLQAKGTPVEREGGQKTSSCIRHEGEKERTKKITYSPPLHTPRKTG